jgi:putative toxin-antitoxin system antitoxin component (TIGR02293 family)
MTQQERIDLVTARAEEVLGSSQAAERWLKDQNPALGFEIPLSMLDTDEGTRMVGDLLGRVEHGVFS